MTSLSRVRAAPIAIVLMLTFVPGAGAADELTTAAAAPRKDADASDATAVSPGPRQTGAAGAVGEAPIDRAAEKKVMDAAKEGEKPPLGILPASNEDALIDPRMARSWSVLPSRWFVASTVDAGFIYLRPRVSLGYGRPFTRWVGVEANPIASGAGMGLYGGLRFEIPHVDLRIGPRYFYSFNRTFLTDRPSYSRLELETDGGMKAKYLTYETELDMSYPLGPGTVLARGSVSYVTRVPDGYNVFEETLHMVVKPPLVWRARAGYALRFGHYSQHSLGMVVDFLDVPKRDDSKTVRVGPVVRMVLSRRVDVRGSFVFTVVSPDRIGLVGGDFTELGVRYRWASE